MYRVTFVPDGVTIHGHSFEHESRSDGQVQLPNANTMVAYGDWQIPRLNECNGTLIFGNKAFTDSGHLPEYANFYTSTVGDTPIITVTEDTVFIVSAQLYDQRPIIQPSTRLTYTVRFESGLPSNMTVTDLPAPIYVGGSVTLPYMCPKCEGYSFMGWAFENDGIFTLSSDMLLQPGDTLNLSDITMYTDYRDTIMLQAVWAETHSVHSILPPGLYYFSMSDTSNFSQYSGNYHFTNTEYNPGFNNTMSKVMIFGSDGDDPAYYWGLEDDMYATGDTNCMWPYNMSIGSGGLIQFTDGSLLWESFEGAAFYVYVQEAQVVDSKLFEFFSYYATYQEPRKAVSGCWCLNGMLGEVYQHFIGMTYQGIKENVNFSCIGLSGIDPYNSYTGFAIPTYGTVTLYNADFGTSDKIMEHGGFTSLCDGSNNMILDFGNEAQEVSPLFWQLLNEIAFRADNESPNYPSQVFDCSIGDDIITITDLGRPTDVPDIEYYHLYINNVFIKEFRASDWPPEMTDIEINLNDLAIPAEVVRSRAWNISILGFTVKDDAFRREILGAYCSDTTARTILPLEVTVDDDGLILSTTAIAQGASISVNGTTVVRPNSSIKYRYSFDELGITDIENAYYDITVRLSYGSMSSGTKSVAVGAVPLVVNLSASKGYVLLATKNTFCDKNIKVVLVD